MGVGGRSGRPRREPRRVLVGLIDAQQQIWIGWSSCWKAEDILEIAARGGCNKKRAGASTKWQPPVCAARVLYLHICRPWAYAKFPRATAPRERIGAQEACPGREAARSHVCHIQNPSSCIIQMDYPLQVPFSMPHNHGPVRAAWCCELVHILRCSTP